jgi:aminopeptidase N
MFGLANNRYVRLAILGSAVWVLLLVTNVCASPTFPSDSRSASFDVLHYNITIEPDIPTKTLSGSVVIRFMSNIDNLTHVEFDCGNLEIETVKQAGAQRQFTVKDRRVSVTVPAMKSRQTTEVEIKYHGAPKFGIRFFPESSQVYTVFSTSQWTVCVDAPEDRATLSLSLVLPSKLTPLSNGRLISKRLVADQKTASVWKQDSPVPTYILGFAAGPYRTITEKKYGVEFQYLVTSFTDDETRRIFRDTPDMLRFFEDHAGVRYADKTYAQVLAAGGVEQEMSSFTALNEAYGKGVLADEKDQWLGAHEFAHQWWGNMLTCRDWNHFWLNEGIATFMAAAYLEHRFGHDVYLREIERYRTSYDKVRAAGKDKSLVFPDWLHPTREDRNLVYDKGAYVMHLLREEMGEEAFWKGLKNYTRKYFGKSVVTSDFVAAMQEASSKNLDNFFAKWVYLKQGNPPHGSVGMVQVLSTPDFLFTSRALCARSLI